MMIMIGMVMMIYKIDKKWWESITKYYDVKKKVHQLRCQRWGMSGKKCEHRGWLTLYENGRQFYTQSNWEIINITCYAHRDKLGTNWYDTVKTTDEMPMIS
jgi:hypothetical protein